VKWFKKVPAAASYFTWQDNRGFDKRQRIEYRSIDEY